MYTSLDQALEHYKKTIRDYLIWSEQKIQEYSRLHLVTPDEVDRDTMLTEDDLSKNAAFTVQVRAMADVLGIDENESIEIIAEVFAEIVAEHGLKQ
ncbi:hypothetical protein A2533_03545 [Candidatus Falkowbacteria bacterium RIFOXYD2_FULL_35_9]|uniref:Uncharacterized protein n=1 Tax=Candidatus Falkowbacteria bacterium RIFOXYC2_FULL_36_12 TaxID=1798002 RepID=A0A1F5T1S0_9BACT|nr:MAG: hypothetical protein A2300_01465 [Candidatus Falkowbacteria bacterium RIFOXYB2_FULL_35_7]OGF32411.1 MAG: hypothetical protein A2478_03770 [Candidatus Falkowbacteria bacterium RIFOXYC2_FULL_36_12]OGF34015.1 MAG: hypothetical protein A2223_03805 [Candidatus Falkowbacteria bacterium RIFOXYA2_FULL_35_8]OGF47382.1 MAG: hypothetical protein A2533_03545 [Candidatus Falkowbacteria bacterium RIFOXYD2_FULL_35_9]